MSATLGGLLPIAGPTTITGSFGSPDNSFTDTNDSSFVGISSPLFYQARIDGAGVMNLGAFDQNASGGPGVSGTLSPEFFGPIGGPGVGSSIGVAFPSFSLTAGDRVQVPFMFLVVPEPGFASLFAVMVIFLVGAARKRARLSISLW